MTKIARFAAAFAAAVAFAGSAFADPYRVRDLAIDVTSTVSPADATTRGREQAKLEGAQRLIDRLTLPQDRAAAGQPLLAADIAAFAGAVTTQVQDRRSNVGGSFRLISVITQSYDAGRVRAYLQSRGVPFVDGQAGKAMIVPAVAGGVDPNAWSAQWTETVTEAGRQKVVGRSDDTVLTPYVASTESWTRRPAWMDVQAELSAARANHAVVAEAYSQGGQIYVRLIDLRTGVADPAGTMTGPFSDLPSARAGVIAEMERAWKEQSVVRTSGSNTARLIALFRDIGEWVRIRRGLETSRLVSSLSVESISSSGADISFVYAGRADQLQADLRSRGVDLRNGDDGWVLQVVSSQ
jgi:hypothetical protein